MKRTCIICHEPILADSAYCPYCGAKQPDPVPADDTPTIMGASPSLKPEPPLSSADTPPTAPFDSDKTQISPPSARQPAVADADKTVVTPPSISDPRSGFAPSEPIGSFANTPSEPYSPYAPPSQQQPSSYVPAQPYGQPQPPYGQPNYQTPNPNYPPPYPHYPAGQQPYGQMGYGAPQYPPQPQGAKKSNVGKWLIGLGIVLLLGAIGYGIFSATRKATLSSNATATAQVIASRPTSTPRPTRTPQPDIPTATISEDFPTPLPAPDLQTLADAKGRLVYFSSSSFELVTAPASGGAETPLKFDNSLSLYSSTNPFAPDGSKIAIYDQQGNGAIIQVANNDGSNLRDVATLTNTVPYELKWSPDSTKLAFIAADSDDENNSERNVFVVDVNAAELRQVSSGGDVDSAPLAWSTNSQRLLFAQGAEALSLHTVNADGTNDQKHLDTYTYSAAWLPDGRIVYEDFCDQAAFNRGICVLDPASNNVEQLTELGDFSIYDISPDAKWLMLDNYADGSMGLFNLETKEIEQVVPPDTTENTRFRIWSVWSPDLQYVTFRDIDTSTTYAYKVGSKQPPIPFTAESIIAWLP